MGANNFVDKIDLLSNLARVQVPWIKVTIGDIYTFGVFDSETRSLMSDETKSYIKAFNVQYPNFVKNLKIKKINGQVNIYTFGLSYPITQFDDPNFFEKVFSAGSKGRKIVFSYGDISNPGFIYREEEAIITKVGQTFSLEASRIDYTVEAVSAASIKVSGTGNHISSGKKVKPSDEIKKLFKSETSLQNMFTGMRAVDLDKFIAGDDKAVELEDKEDIGALDYLNYLVACMQPADAPEGLPTANYILTIHDNTANSNDSVPSGISGTGPFFKVTKVDKAVANADAFTLTIGYNTSTIVTEFSIENNESYAMYFEYQNEIHPKKYVRRLNKLGQWEDEYCPVVTSRVDTKKTMPNDENWWKLITAFPINASVKIVGLLRPATLMQYVRLNVVFPGGHKHISSGLYLVTAQEDTLDENGYYTVLSLTRLSGDEEYEEVALPTYGK
jgi:hypothetical protein